MDKRQIGVGTFTVTPRMRELVGLVLDTGRISYGPFCREFEARFAALHDCKHGVLSNSGTSSLQVALQALKIQCGWADWSEVLIPAVTFVATANVCFHNRLWPVPVDVDPVYYEMDPELVEAAITPKTVAMMPVSLFGLPADLPALTTIARRHGLAVIEDSCECCFVGIDGRKVGSWGDVGCFSFYTAHILTTGVGGMATTNDPELAVRMRSLVNHGRDGIYISTDDDNGLTASQLKEVVSRRFRFETKGFSYRCTELEAALGVAQLGDWESIIARRQQNAHFIIDGLRQFEDRLVIPLERNNAGHAWMMMPLVLRGEGKWDLCNFLEERGIETREMLPLINQPCYAHLWTGEYPMADWINRSGFYVASHADLVGADLDYILCGFEEFFGHH